MIVRARGRLDAYIELIEQVENITKPELQRLEGQYIRLNKCVNKIIQGRTRKEWEEDNKVSRNVYGLNYRIENYDKILVRKKLYRESHVEEIKLSKTKKYTCVCGKELNFYCKPRHLKVCKGAPSF